jgi:hypothetical protein
LCKICRFFPRIGVLFGKKKYIKWIIRMQKLNHFQATATCTINNISGMLVY